MKGKYAAGFIIFFLLHLSAMAAGLEIKLKFDHAEYIQYEPVRAIITISNKSRKTFFYDPSVYTETKMRFIVAQDPHSPLSAKNRNPMAKPFSLQPGESRMFMITVTDFYSITAVGRYFMGFVTEWNGVPQYSNTEVVDVVTGLPLKSVRASVPDYDYIEREYMLQYLARDGRESLFLLTKEADGTAYGTMLLGNLIRANVPAIEVDSDGMILVTHQCAPNLFVKSIIESNLDGLILLDKFYYDRTGSRITYSDIPSPVVEEKEEEPKRPWWKRIFRRRSKSKDKKDGTEKNAPEVSRTKAL